MLYTVIRYGLVMLMRWQKVPKCYPCQQEFHLRADWDIHKFTADHLKVLAEKGITEVRMHYDLFLKSI